MLILADSFWSWPQGAQVAVFALVALIAAGVRLVYGPPKRTGSKRSK